MAKQRIVNVPVSAIQTRSLGADTSAGWETIVGGSRAPLRNVDRDAALAAPPVFACVRLISDIVSTLPMSSYIEDDRQVRTPYNPMPEWLRFNAGPSQPLNRVSVMGQGVMSSALDGNTYFATGRNSLGDIIYVECLDPTKVEPFRADDGAVRYRVSVRNGQTVVADQMDITHIPALMLPGALKGLSPLAAARKTIGMSLGLNQYGAGFYESGAKPSFGVEVPGPLTPVGRDQMREAFEAVHAGVGNMHRVAIITEGAKFRELSINPNDAAFLGAIKAQVPQVCMFYGVHPSRLGHSESAQLGSSIAEQNSAFAQDTIRPYVARFESGLSDAQRLSGSTPDNVIIGMDLASYMRGDYASQIQTNATAVREGIIVPNEARQQIGYAPTEWGDRPISVQIDLDGTGDGEADEQRSIEDAVAEMQNVAASVGKVLSPDDIRRIFGDDDK